ATGTTQINVGNSTKVSSIKSLSGQRQDWREVETITLDDYWVKVGRPKVKLIKIDVEGAESLVINGMKTLLRESSPHIMLEMHLFALDDAEKQVIIDILFAKNRYIARLLYVTDLGSKYRKIPKETFESWEGIKSYLADAHTAGLHLFPNSGRGASIESSSPHQ